MDYILGFQYSARQILNTQSDEVLLCKSASKLNILRASPGPFPRT